MVGKHTQRLQITDVAIAAIRAAKGPIGSGEIIEFARQHGMMDIFGGKTPQKSVQAAIWKSINILKSPSPFVMSDKGRHHQYSLKESMLKRQERLVVRRKNDTLIAEWVPSASR